MIERNNIGYGAQRHKVELFGQIRLRNVFALKPPAFPKATPQRKHHVKDHAHACDAFTRKLTAGLIGVYDRIGCRQLAPRQVMVCDKGLNSCFARSGYTLKTRDAIVDGDNEIRSLCFCELNDFGG